MVDAQVMPQSQMLFESANHGVIGHLQKGSYGQFSEVLDGIRTMIPKIELSLPRVVFVGSRDAGKSSVLESVTKCAVFP